jgi:hypothetical protein
MRIRSLLTVLTALPLLVGLAAAPASAGTGASTWCNDGSGWRELAILSSPVTVGVEVFNPPGVGWEMTIICYSASPAGTPGGLTGGALFLDLRTVPGTTYPGVYADPRCDADPEVGVAPTCALPNNVFVAPGDVAVSTPPSSVCIVSLGSGCLAYVPGVKVATGTDPDRQTLGLRIVGIDLPVDLPAQCVAVVVTCP